MIYTSVYGYYKHDEGINYDENHLSQSRSQLRPEGYAAGNYFANEMNSGPHKQWLTYIAGAALQVGKPTQVANKDHAARKKKV